MHNIARQKRRKKCDSTLISFESVLAFSIVTKALTCIISETKRDIGRKLQYARSQTLVVRSVVISIVDVVASILVLISVVVVSMEVVLMSVVVVSMEVVLISVVVTSVLEAGAQHSFYCNVLRELHSLLHNKLIYSALGS